MKFVPLVLALLSIGVGLVESVGNFQIVSFFQNVPDALQDEMVNKTFVTISFLQQFLMNCDWVDPGYSQPSGNQTGLVRHLSSVRSEVYDEDEEEGLDSSRELSLIDCPNKCSKSGSTYCRSLGCAFCGRCRRRERKLALVTAKYMGNNWMPRSAFPLGNCQADCDVDADCLPGMYCFQRSIGSPLPPGCTGRSTSNEDDYCVWAPTKAPTRFPTRKPTTPPTKSPTKKPSKNPTKVPSTPPTPSPTKKQTKAPTKPPSTPPTGSPIKASRPPPNVPSERPTKAPTKLPTRFPSPKPTTAPTRAPQTATPTRAPQTSTPTTAPSSQPSGQPSMAPSTDDTDLLAQDVDEDFATFLSTPGVSALTIEERLDRHANFYYCTLQGIPNCRIWYKIMQILNNGTTYPVTGWPEM